MTADPVTRIAGHLVAVTPKTRWTFFEVETRAGLVGVGEGTLNGRNEAVLTEAQRMAATIFALSHAVPMPLGMPRDLTQAAVISALDQALWDIAGQRTGEAVAAALGGTQRGSVPLYANINRRTLDRRPEGFAASARDAVAAGFDAVKIAPFDEAVPGVPHAPRALEPGLARIAATRAALGPAPDLMVDCHWRLTEAEAADVIREVAAQDVYWVECPLPETEETLQALQRLRALANANGIRLAGCELGIGHDGFAPFLRAGAYDAMMPDAKYVGGLAEMLRLSETFARAGVAFSPHNPTGPVCHAASLQVCAAAAHLDRLEVQFDETALFGELVGGALPPARAGRSALPGGAGLGMAFAQAVLERHRVAGFVSTP